MSKKNSDTSIRVLETLKILTNSSASIQDIIRHFEKIDPHNRVYTNEVILKYLNTFKVYGFRITKQKDKYVLLNAPHQFDLTEDDLRAIYRIEKFCGLFPERKINTEVSKFLQELEKRFSDNTRLIAHNMRKPNFANLRFSYNKYNDKIKKYEKYCIDEQRIKITYKKQNNLEFSIIVEPNEIKYKSEDVYFSVYNPASAQIQDLNFNSILKVEQLPLKSNPTNMVSSVTFQLKDRLAKVYKLHEGEKLLLLKEDESIIILNQKEDRDLLLRRLIRYGELCEVISPNSLREDMKKLIEETISNYR